MKIGERVKGLYVSDGVSQAAFARRCGLEPYEVSRIVTGRRRPQLHQLQVIATAEEIELEELVVGTDAEHLLGQEPKLVSRSELQEVLQRALKAEEEARLVRTEREVLRSELGRFRMLYNDAEAGKVGAEEMALEKKAQAAMLKVKLDGAERRVGAAEVQLMLAQAKQEAQEKEHADLQERFSIGGAQYGQLWKAYNDIKDRFGKLWHDYEALAQEHAVEVHDLRASKIATAGLTGLLGLAFGAMISGDEG